MLFELYTAFNCYLKIYCLSYAAINIYVMLMLQMNKYFYKELFRKLNLQTFSPILDPTQGK